MIQDAAKYLSLLCGSTGAIEIATQGQFALAFPLNAAMHAGYASSLQESSLYLLTEIDSLKLTLGFKRRSHMLLPLLAGI